MADISVFLDAPQSGNPDAPAQLLPLAVRLLTADAGPTRTGPRKKSAPITPKFNSQIPGDPINPLPGKLPALGGHDPRTGGTVTS
jgi:hypothetical protein